MEAIIIETNIEELRKNVKNMEELYSFIQEIAKTDNDTLAIIYGTCQLDHIILDNSLKELYEKWILHKKYEEFLVTGVEDRWIHVDKETWAEYIKAKERLGDIESRRK